MAEKTLKKVEEELNCSICLDTYSDPKLLQCFHAYCRKCLVKLVVRDQQGQLILTCPICCHDTPVPANGVAGLQPAFQINHFLEIMKEHKKAAADPPASAENVEKESASLISCNKVKVCCHEHVGKEVELFCETCGEPICLRCALKGGKHNTHEYEELDKAFEKYKVEVTASLEPMEKQVTTITTALAQLDAHCAEVSDQRAAVEADIHATFGKLQHILDARKTAHRPTPPHHSEEVKGAGSPEGPVRDHSGPAKQLSRLYEGEPQDWQSGRGAVDEELSSQTSEGTDHHIPSRHVEAQHRS